MGGFFEGIFWEDFLKEFFGRIFWEEFFGRNFLGENFWEDFFGRNSLFTLLKSAKLLQIDLFVKILVFVKFLSKSKFMVLKNVDSFGRRNIAGFVESIESSVKPRIALN